jgi:hypothetical protein
MGTRADFYIGRGKDAEWIGSVGMDGYPTGLTTGDSAEESPSDVPILIAKTDADFRKAVADLIAARRHGTKPEQGWPWPWDDSRTTDYAYAFDGGQVWGSMFGHSWWKANEAQPDGDDDATGKVDFPDMASRKNVTLGARSGLMVFGGPA